MFKTIKRTEGISTTDIVGRMLLMNREHHVRSVWRATCALHPCFGVHHAFVTRRKAPDADEAKAATESAQMMRARANSGDTADELLSDVRYIVLC